METVRTRIIREILARLTALTDVFGRVIRGLDPSLEVADVLAAGKAVAEVYVFDDVDIGPRESQVESFEFQVVLLIYLPAPGAQSLGTDWDGVVDRVHQAVYGTIAGGDQHSFGGLAQDTTPGGGWGVAYDEQGIPHTGCEFTVRYGHVIGDTTSAS